MPLDARRRTAVRFATAWYTPLRLAAPWYTPLRLATHERKELSSTVQPADQRHFRPTDPREVIRFEEAADLTIEARLARVEAKLAISNVLATYAAAVQCGDTEATWDCFSEDVEYTLDGSVTMHATGKAAVLEHFRTHRGFI